MPMIQVSFDRRRIHRRLQKRQMIEKLTDAMVSIEGGKHARRHLG